MESINKCNIGDKLILDLGIESFIGELQFINKDKTRLKLKNVINLNTKVVYKTDQNFFLSDIVSITQDKKDFADDDLVGNVENNRSNTLILNSIRNDTNDHNITLEQKYKVRKKNLKIRDFCRIDKCVDNIKYIIQTDANYHSALQDLNNQKIISVYIEPCKFGRNDGPTTIITIYSPDTNIAYVFDINLMGKIHSDFANIFLNRKIIKIIYDGRLLCDHFKHKHHINLDGIFDCLVSHLNITKSNMKISLRECFWKYISFPNSYYCKEEEEIDWHARPLDNLRKTICAKTVVLLYKLYEIHNQILTDQMSETFSELCNRFAQTYSNNNDSIEVGIQMSTNDTTSTNYISNTNLHEHLSLQHLNL